ncbi:MAG TPA: DUF1338 domain-containing protein [Elusimicrobiota bacterium]|nr:DUF1338 domain-containing protein [Elusimicrobiota bacterium]
MKRSGAGAREAFLRELFDALWRRYRDRVSYARVYEDVLRSHGGAFRNDHVAFRTIASQRPWSGLAAVARPFEALGYTAAATYRFPDKNLSSIHLAPPAPDLPKVFVSELRAWELPARARRVALAAAAKAKPSLSDDDLAALHACGALSKTKREALLARLLAHFDRPWPVPAKADVATLERESQFGAWVLLHGHAVNHFTASIDAHGVDSLGDIEKTVAALKAAGVPMKPEIEGARGSRLRQSSTRAVVLPTPMRVGARVARVPWTYAYFELAERPLVDGRRFEGFLGGQATNLFEMTRRA